MTDETTAPRAARWPLVVAVLVLAIVLVALLTLRSQLGEALGQARSNAVEQFESGVLGPPGSLNFLYADLMRAARLVESQPLIKQVLVEKVVDTTPEGEPRFHLVHPYWARASREGREGAAWETQLLHDATGRTIGRLQLRLDRAPLLAADLTVAATFLLLAGATWTLVRRARHTEVRLKHTTIELEEKRRQLIQTERLALTGRLTAGLLHDLRKPVLAIRDEAEDAAEADGVRPETWKRVLEQTELFQGMLKATRIERFARSGAVAPEERREWCDLHDILRRSLDLVRYERKDVEVVERFTAESLLVEADPFELIQVFSNVALNAFQAMEGHGTLTLETRAEQSGGGPREAVIAISDTGPGIPSELREQLFEPFRTSREAEGGSGLGMFIAREIVESLGGSIEVTDAPEGGAMFVFTLPMEEGR